MQNTLLQVLPWSSKKKLIFISNNGSDSNTGEAGEPIRTIEKLNTMDITQNTHILFERGGVYPGTIELNSDGHILNPIEVSAYGTGENPIIIGVDTLSGWTQLNDSVYYAIDDNLLSLYNSDFINDSRCPDTGFYNITYTSSNNKIVGDLPDYDFIGSKIRIRTNAYTWEVRTISGQSGDTLIFSPTSYSFNDGYFFITDCRECLSSGEYHYSNDTVYLCSDTTNITVGHYNTGLSLSGDYVNIQNLSFHKFSQAISTSSHNTTINNCYIQDCLTSGISLTSSQNLTISNNTIKRIGLIPGYGTTYAYNNGIYVNQNSSSITIIRNSVDSVGYNGIRSDGSTTICENNVSNYCMTKTDGGGVYVINENNPKTICRNYVYSPRVPGNNVGYTSSTSGIYLDDYSKDVNCYSNIVIGSGGNGIYLHNTLNANIHDNYLSECRLYFRFNSTKYSNYTNVAQDNYIASETETELEVVSDDFSTNLTLSNKVKTSTHTVYINRSTAIINNVVNKLDFDDNPITDITLYPYESLILINP